MLSHLILLCFTSIAYTVRALHTLAALDSYDIPLALFIVTVRFNFWMSYECCLLEHVDQAELSSLFLIALWYVDYVKVQKSYQS